MIRSRFLIMASLLAAALALVGCNAEPPKTEAVKAPEKREVSLLAARPCLDRISEMALRWQSDAMPYHLESQSNAEATGQDGKSTVWEASFASRSSRTARTFFCSGSRLKESPAVGVTANREFPVPAGTTMLTFNISDLQVDSDAVAKLANDHGGASLVQKDPKQPVYFELGVDPKSSKLIWAAVYGQNQKHNLGIGLVDATQPKFLGAFRR